MFGDQQVNIIIDIIQTHNGLIHDLKKKKYI